MIKFDIEPLRKLYAEYHDRKRYMKLAEANERKVVEWRSATGEMISPHPFQHECFGAVFGWLEKGQKAKVRQVDHGLDAEGRILIAREAFRAGHSAEEDLEETQYVHNGNQITAITAYSRRKPKDFEVTNLERFTYKVGRLLSYERFYWRAASIDVCSWKGDRVEQTEYCGADHVSWYHPNQAKYREWKGSKELRRSQRTYEFDADGELARAVQHCLNDAGEPDPKSRYMFYVRPIPGVTIAKLSDEVEELLTAAIPKAVKQKKTKSAAYCLLVCYCGEDYHGGWPPFLVVGGEKWRDKIVQEATDVKYYLWAPDEMRDKPENVEIMLDDSRLNEKCMMHLDLMSAKEQLRSGPQGAAKRGPQAERHALGRNPQDDGRFHRRLRRRVTRLSGRSRRTSRPPISEKQFADLIKRKLL